MNLFETFSEAEFVALMHTAQYQPPVSIRDYRALSREILLNGKRTAFYFGTGNNDTRVNFEFGGFWWHITECDQHPPVNLYPLLWDLGNHMNFVTVD
jgi:hypothetical protein